VVTYSLGMLAMAVFAVTGVVAGGKKDMDILTIVILGNVTAIGGGTLRDILLDVNPIYWIADLTYLWVATAASIAAFFLVPKISRTFKLLEYADGPRGGNVLGAGDPKNIVTGILLAGCSTDGHDNRHLRWHAPRYPYGPDAASFQPRIICHPCHCRLFILRCIQRLVRIRLLLPSNCHFNHFYIQSSRHPLAIYLS
jgi:hypothetical protein